MQTEEINTCSFCKLKKPVLRQYLNARNKPTTGDGFSITYYCNDCGLGEKVIPMTSQTPEETPRKDFGFEPKHPDGLPNIEKDCTTDCPWCDGYPPCEYRIGYNDGFNTLHPQLQKAHLRGYRLAVKHLKEAYTANGATTVPEAIEWLEDNLRLYRDELDQDVSITSEDKQD